MREEIQEPSPLRVLLVGDAMLGRLVNEMYTMTCQYWSGDKRGKRR
jgi:hypothetical protein